MNYDNVAKIVQITGEDMPKMSKKVNAYLKYQWKILAISQVGGSADGYWNQPVIILGHVNENAAEPKQDDYTKVWS